MRSFTTEEFRAAVAATSARMNALDAPETASAEVLQHHVNSVLAESGLSLEFMEEVDGWAVAQAPELVQGAVMRARQMCNDEGHPCLTCIGQSMGVMAASIGMEVMLEMLIARGVNVEGEVDVNER